MQHLLQISRKIDYALRALIYLASLPGAQVSPLQEIVDELGLPREFLAKILKSLTARGLVRSTRGAHGGYTLAKSPAEISFLDAIEAAGGPVQINVCLDHKDRCEVSASCSMYHVWKAGQDRMLEVYRRTTLAELAQPMSPLVPIGLPAARASVKQ
jgi:Rrf2 family protein